VAEVLRIRRNLWQTLARDYGDFQGRPCRRLSDMGGGWVRLAGTTKGLSGHGVTHEIADEAPILRVDLGGTKVTAAYDDLMDACRRREE